ncbi:uncharacterized protein LOC111786489 [Cucurbita pepo subsp. pepo]|uniref:uncharacterized protein LOC111777661 n=1 Tax=Cucurbita pepo subsp. pepo TaxID=3664 RepID=UPI000C9D6944|nr:uncharacterized protein LOC111777661 [Cucurbita pepo subsp. pepo]XP_023522505.1 uncharacterized protein LOC111786489 [Cucurbita pepo subsp. pepo]
MEVAVGVSPAGDLFNFGSPCSSHYLSAPSTPFSSLSAPTSPSSLAVNFFRHDDDVPIGSPSAVPFRWEEKPGIPKSPNCSAEQDFEFDFSRQSLCTKASLSADELFVGGKIRPLKPPPGFQSNMSSPRSPHNSRISPRKTKNSSDMNINDDPFEAALMKETLNHRTNYELADKQSKNRGRTEEISYISSNFDRKPTRSVSPYRISSRTPIHGDGDSCTVAGKSKSLSFLSAISFSKANRKWRLRDLLFRSTSEGRATEKADKLRSTYVVMSERMENDVKISSFRSADSVGPRRHFTAANRTVSEEFMKKRSFLGRCLRFNRSGMQEISRDIGSLTRG